MGKGSRPRPFSVTQAEYDARWDMIFGRDKQSETKETEQKTEDVIDQPLDNKSDSK